MALFTIQRFMGDEDGEFEGHNPTKAFCILEQLRAEALARKQNRLSDQDSKHLSTDIEMGGKLSETSLSSSKTKQKLKRKEKQNDGECICLDNNESGRQISKRRRKSESLKEGAHLSSDDLPSPEKHALVNISKDDVSVGSPKYHRKHKKDDTQDEAETLDDNSNISKGDVSIGSLKYHRKHKKDDTQDEAETLDDNSNISKGDVSIGSLKYHRKHKKGDTKNEAEPLDDNEIPAKDSLTDIKSQHGETEDEGNTRQEGPHEIGGFTVLGDYKKKHVEKVKRVLPEWLANPSVITADVKSYQVPVSSITRLHPVLLDNLSKNGITQFFPVQSQVIPVLLDVIRHSIRVGPGGYLPSDICVSAPTGSGKTLAFVLPIVQALKDCVVRKVRAVAVLPVRDLASQVYKVFQAYCEGTKVKVGLLVGQKTFEGEQIMLVKKKHLGYQSLVDVLVTTPGRLVDHINKTEGLDLTHLRFLVIDEADRMIDDIKQDWLQTLENAVYQSDSTTWGSCTRVKPGIVTVASSQKNQIPLQKLLFSATLSQNPEKLQNLNLFQPKLFTSVVKTSKQDDGSTQNDTLDPHKTNNVSGDFVGKYTTPAGLTEYFIESNKAERPLVILHFLHTLKFRQVLCFTNSVESTHRLHHLIKLIGGIEVREFSSGLHATRRSKILRKFSAGHIDILICSDAMARGMDVENVKYVISYDAPPFIKTYIHRVGRTARAGKTGISFTLLQQKEIFHFKKMIWEAGKTGVKEMKIAQHLLEAHIPTYQEALKQLPEVIKSEKTKKTK